MRDLKKGYVNPDFRIHQTQQHVLFRDPSSPRVLGIDPLWSTWEEYDTATWIAIE